MEYKVNIYKFLTWITGNPVWVTSVIWEASANASVVAWCTISKLCTCTWVNAFLIFTFQCVPAIWVNEAFVLSTLIIWVSSVALLAATESLMESGRTDRICPTLLEQARISAFSVIACFSQGTFVVRFTASYNNNYIGLEKLGLKMRGTYALRRF